MSFTTEPGAQDGSTGQVLFLPEPGSQDGSCVQVIFCILPWSSGRFLCSGYLLYLTLELRTVLVFRFSFLFDPGAQNGSSVRFSFLFDPEDQDGSGVQIIFCT